MGSKLSVEETKLLNTKWQYGGSVSHGPEEDSVTNHPRETQQHQPQNCLRGLNKLRSDCRVPKCRRNKFKPVCYNNNNDLMHPGIKMAANMEDSVQTCEVIVSDSVLSDDSNSVLMMSETHPQNEKTGMSGLRRETQNVCLELEKAKESIKLLRDRERQLRDRLSDQAQKLFHMSNTRFEDLSLGDKRPTALISKYGDLYSQGRVDALDALDALDELAGLDDLKGKLLFSVVVLAFRSCQHSWKDLRSKIRHLLQLPSPAENNNKDSVPISSVSKEMELYLDQYFCQTVDRFDVSKNVQEVTSQIHGTLFDYPSLADCEGLNKYIKDSVQLAWSLTVQNPQFVLQYDSKAFHPHYHTRFPESDPENTEISGVIWPALLEGEDGPCVQKGVVIT